MHRLLLAMALVALPAVAATVYKTVDAEGKVSYSDKPPAPGVATEVIETPENYAAPDPAAAERLQEMRETTERLRADRLERERDVAGPPAPVPYPAPPAYADEDDDDRWLVPYYPPYRRWDGGARPHPPRPPYVRPPDAPPDNGISPRGLRGRIRATR